MESAEGILNLMKESNLEPSSYTYTLLASGYAKKGDIEKVIEVLDICENKDIYLTDREYLDIIYALVINGHSDKVDQVNLFKKEYLCLLTTVNDCFIEIQILIRIPKTSGYNQDVINCIYKLITVGQENMAFKLFDTMTRPIKIDGTSPPIGRFLIGQLTKVNSVRKIIFYYIHIYIIV